MVTVFGEEDPPTGSIYQPGEQITIELLTESSKPDIGEEGFSGWSDTVSKVYEVMAVVELQPACPAIPMSLMGWT